MDIPETKEYPFSIFKHETSQAPFLNLLRTKIEDINSNNAQKI